MAHAFLLELVAGLCFLAVAVPLLRAARRTGSMPERAMGWIFLLMGGSYVCYELPYVLPRQLPLESQAGQSSIVLGRLAYDASVAAVALFTRRVFHHGEIWATGAAWSSVALMSSGFFVSTRLVDWRGEAPLANPGFWLEWVGQVLPFAWLTTASVVARDKARRRTRAGVGSRAVANRFLLLSLFGALQLATLMLLLPMYMILEAEDQWSSRTDLVLGILELASILVVCLAYLPPRAYRRWIDRPASAAGAGGS